MHEKKMTGHFAALLTIFIWGTTFISTKILLTDFQPVEILFYRFFIGFLALCVVCPKRMRVKEKKHEITFALAGLCGICLYYFLENIALTYTLASNVGVIISTAPFFTAILTRITGKQEERLRAPFFVGFLTAMAGILLLSLGGFGVQLNPRGDLLAVLAAFVWACYAVLSKKISGYGYQTVQATRRTFAYGLVFMLPCLYWFDFQPGLSRFTEPSSVFHILFLGLGASALCFVTWNLAVRILGAVKTSVYIYLVPVITVATSVLVLKERLTVSSAVGIVLTLAGLFISEGKWNFGRSVKSDGLTE